MQQPMPRTPHRTIHAQPMPGQFEMCSIFDNAAYVVVHVAYYSRATLGLVHGFELVDKERSVSVYLHGDAALAFQGHIHDWQDNTPDETDVEAVIDGFMSLGRVTLASH